jgi:hypothetical protein
MEVRGEVEAEEIPLTLPSPPQAGARVSSVVSPNFYHGTSSLKIFSFVEYRIL